MTDQRYAVIELGTRGIRLLVADASASGIDRVVCSTGGFSELGSNRDAAGNIRSDAILHSRKRVSDYVQLAHAKGAGYIEVFATEAVRSAPNKREFIMELAPAAEVVVVSSDQEAYLSLVASVAAFRMDMRPGNTVLVLDQGGGSTELACGMIDEDNTLVLLNQCSLKVGTVELANQLLQAGSTIEGFKCVKDTIKEALQEHCLFDVFKDRPPTAVYGVGSAITQYAQTTEVMNACGNHSTDYHGRKISRVQIDEFVNLAREQSNSSPQFLHCDDHRPIMVAGLLAYQQIMETYGASEIKVSRHGLRYGVLLRMAGYPFRQQP